MKIHRAAIRPAVIYITVTDWQGGWGKTVFLKRRLFVRFRGKENKNSTGGILKVRKLRDRR